MRPELEHDEHHRCGGRGSADLVSADDVDPADRLDPDHCHHDHERHHSGVGPASGPLTATPASGSLQSVIHFAFVAPDTGTVQGHDEVSATLSVMGPQKAGCIGIHEQPLPALAAGRQATVSVGPAQLGGDWCPGTYTARVEVLARPKWRPGHDVPAVHPRRGVLRAGAVQDFGLTACGPRTSAAGPGPRESPSGTPGRSSLARLSGD